MASPFSVFRQYQKVLIAVFGVGLMIAFLVEGSLLNILTGGGPSRGATGRPTAAVTFKGGALTDEQLIRMHRTNTLADMYVERVKAEAQKASKDAVIGMFPYVDAMGGGEARLVNHYLLARKAHEMGMSLSNQDIDELLLNMADNALDRNDLKKIRQKLLAEDINSTIIITEDQLYAQLRTNLLAQELMAMIRNSAQPLQFERMGFVMPSSMILPPARAWEMFRRTARQAKVELLPLEVEKFVDQVTVTPTPRQKDELFEKYKDRVPAPFSSEPGFATPHRIAFGYVRVDFQPFLDKAKGEVTEEAIRANYDERAEKGEFTVPVDKSKNEEGMKEDQKPEDQEKEVDAKPAESNSEEKKPDDAQPAAEPKDDAAQEDGADKEGEEEENDEELNEEEPADAADTEPSAEAQPAEKDKPADDKPAGEEKQPEGDKPAAEEQPEAAQTDTNPADGEGKEQAADDEKKPDEKKPETRVKTFEEMKESIREQLGQKPASDAQREAIDEVFKALEEYRAKYHEWEAEKEALASAKGSEKKEASAQPELLPVISAALKKYGFKYQQTQAIDAFEIEGTEIGKASVGLPNQQQIPLSEVYMYEIGLFQAFPASEGFLRDTQYVLWKETDLPQRSAERKEVEEELVRAVKMQEAFKLAKDEAELLAAKAREQADQSLRKTLGAVDKAAAIVEPAPFSWLSSGFAPGGMGIRLQPTEIPEVPYPGEEFMQTVLDLQPGEVGVAADEPHKRVYVIRLISQTPDEDILRQMFLTKGVSDRNVSQQYNSERLQTIGAWMDHVVTDQMQVKWNRQPQQFDRF